MKIAALVIGVGLVLTSVTQEGEAATTVAASGGYYTFRGTVSSLSGTRLLADKATAIGFPGQDTITFLEFNRGLLPGALSPNQKALLRLQHDPSLGGNLFPAEASRPLSVGVYAVEDIFDPPGAGNFDVVYGVGGSAARRHWSERPEFYSWDVTALVRSWLADPAAGTTLALSGIYGNLGRDPQNAYAIFRPVGSTTGLAPEIAITPIPATLPLLAAALGGLGLLVRERHQRRHA